MHSDRLKELKSSGLAYRIAYFGLLPTIAAILVAALLSPEHIRQTLLLLALLVTLLCLHISVIATRKFHWREAQRLASEEETRLAKVQMQELFAMTDMLQSADCHEHAGAVLEATARGLLPQCGGALYVFNNSRDRLDLIKAWNTQEDIVPVETLLPSSCWAIKRGKVHLNQHKDGALQCFHQLTAAITIEVPMLARGSLFGLLVITVPAHLSDDAIPPISRIAQALADSMSLALCNIALSEKLKTQSMRDALTGLYNRRYMEDALERSIATASRENEPTSVVMIDLDNFKRLNDEHGHAKGDAVLRDVAASLVGSLRPSDTVSRYGGEELLIVLPSTNLHDAAAKAESLRIGVERLSAAHGVPVSASFGVAALPTCVTDPKLLIAAADTALYEAKKAGKNCVRTAARLDGVDPQLDFQPKLVVS